MAIDIRNVGSGKLTSLSNKDKKVSSSNLSISDDDTQPDDQVELTGQAAKISSLIQQMMKMPAVDYSRVDPIKQKIDEGRFEIEPERIAHKMLDFEVSYSRYK